MSEFGFIDDIKRLFADVPMHGFEGIGDDCAVLPVGNGEALVFTTDVLVEDVHFLRRATSAAELGAKALAVNLSDVAAMGAEPVASLLSIALTEDAVGVWADEFMRGYREMSGRWGVALVGGDTSASKSGIVINVVAIGRVCEENIKRRSAARAGDVIAVCGVLGASAAGLRDILAGRLDTEFARVHRNAEPQVREGMWLGCRSEVHAMMDLSDGLASDLVHILRASGVGARVDIDDIPAASTVEDAVCGGEDYKLLFTADGGMANELASAFVREFGYSFSVLGRIESSPDPSIRWFGHGCLVSPDWHGFTHF